LAPKAKRMTRGTHLTLGTLGLLAAAGYAARGSLAQAGRKGFSVNAREIWGILSAQLYGSKIDAPVLATREALQNARDAIDKAWKLGQIAQDEGRFEVEVSDNGNTMTWRDNGVGMTPEIFYDKFLDLGSTTKGEGGGSAGGFGIAKASIFGLSKSFHWRLRTQDRTYEGHGFDDVPTEEISPWIQGTELTIYDIDGPKYAYHRGDDLFGHYDHLENRLRMLLAANTLNPTARHAGIRLFLNGEEIGPFFHGRSKILLDNAELSPGVFVTMKAYPERHSTRLYARLDGLAQFSSSIYGFPYNLVVDLKSKLSPRHEGYPLPADRNRFTPGLQRQFEKIIEDLRELQASGGDDDKAPNETQVGLDEGDLNEVMLALQESRARVEQTLHDPKIAERLRFVEGGSDILRSLQEEVWQIDRKISEIRERLYAEREAREEQERQRRWAQQDKPYTPAPAPPMRPPPTRTGPSLDKLKPKAKPPKAPKKLKRVNPFLGYATLKINRNDFPEARLRKYFLRAGRYQNMALAWRIALQLILQQAKESLQFDVGLVFETKTFALAERKDRKITLYLNPEWMDTTLKAYAGRPLNVAAILHAKACHELAHALGYWHHGDSYAIERERLADESIGALYPLSAVCQELLGLRNDASPEAKQISALEKKVAQLERFKARRTSKSRGSRNDEDLKEDLMTWYKQVTRGADAGCKVEA